MENRPTWDEFGPLFDPEVVENLRIIQNAAGAEIVVSFSWKMEGLGRMRELWRSRALPGKVAGVSPDAVFDTSLLTMDLDDPEVLMQLAGKGNEVGRWLESNPGEVRYAILDDVPDFLPDQDPFFVMTDSRCGLTMEVAIKVIGIPNS